MPHPALHTPLVDLLGCEVPVLLAGMGGVARHEVAVAVSEAGGFGCLGMVREPPQRIRQEVLGYRRLCHRPFAVNLIPAATDAALLREQLRICHRLAVPAIALFWDVDVALVRHLKAEGLLVLHQIGCERDAELALEAGADVLIAQGMEAGGHVRSRTTTLALVPEIVRMSPAPVVASGGIGSGAALVAALALGAQGVSCGSAFLATREANAHLRHKERLLQARASDTVLTEKFFRNWPMPAPVRVLENAVTRGEFDDLHAARATPVIGRQDEGPVFLFSTDSPLRDATGDIDDMAIYAGQSCGQINDLCSAAERLRRMISDAEHCLRRLQGDVRPGTPPAAAAAAPAAAVAADAPPRQAAADALAAALQELLAAERAGALVAASTLREEEGTVRQRRLLEKIHRGEADSCRRLRFCLLQMSREPSREIGAFHEKAMAITDLDRRLAFIDKGQRWVIRKLKECLALCEDKVIRRELKAVLATHEANSNAVNEAQTS